MRQQLCQPGARVKTGYPLLGAVHHQANAFNGQTGFGNIGGQYHFTLPRRRGKDGLALVTQRQCAVERAKQYVAAHAGGKLLLHPLDFANARQKQQQRTGFLTKQVSRGDRHRFIETLMGRKRLIAALNRKRAPFGGDDRRIR